MLTPRHAIRNSYDANGDDWRLITMPLVIRDRKGSDEKREPFKPYWSTNDGDTIRLYRAHVIDGLRGLPARSVQCVVTSPPYWGLRDYGTAQWEGGDPKCDHSTAPTVRVVGNAPSRKSTLTTNGGRGPKPGDKYQADRVVTVARTCPCGARRIDSQLGSESVPDCGAWGGKLSREFIAATIQRVMAGPQHPNIKAGILTDLLSDARPQPCTECYICRMVAVFDEVRRVLRDDGTVWLNMGDTYASGNCGGEGVFANGRTDGRPGDGGRDRTAEARGMMKSRGASMSSGLPSGNLVGVPWRLALALQANGWVLRQDIVWCLSGGTWVYARTQKGEMPMMLRDAARLDPSTVQLWNGTKWTQVLGWSRSYREGDEIELVLRSGERTSCTPNHKFPVSARHAMAPHVLKEAGDIKIGDRLIQTRLPEPIEPLEPEAIPTETAWFIGLYLAEGSTNEDCISLAGHALEVDRWERVQRVVRFYGGSCSLRVEGNNQSITVHSRLLRAILDDYLGGSNALTKYLKVRCWKHSNAWLRQLLMGYLEGDAHRDEANDRWRLGFCRNYSLERDLRVLSARLGFHLCLKPTFATGFGRKFPTFRGEIRFSRSGHLNQRDMCEVVEIRRAKCREVYDVGVEDEPHLFALASGVLTHNSKPNPMPESVQNRCTKSHEYIFLLTKSSDYFCDMEAIREPHAEPWRSTGKAEGSGQKGSSAVEGGVNSGFGLHIPGQKMVREYNPAGRNKRSVWTVPSDPYPGAHYATFPKSLIEPCIRAGTSEKGACAKCGAPWRRVIEPSERYAKHLGVGFTDHKSDSSTGYVGETKGGGKSKRHELMSDGMWCADYRTIGWEPTCSCHGTFVTVKRMVKVRRRKDGAYSDPYDRDHSTRSNRNGMSSITLDPDGVEVEIVEEEQAVQEYRPSIPLEDHPTRRCIVLDPFMGSGTTAVVGVVNHCQCWGIELSEEYLTQNAIPRIRGLLLSRPSLSHLVRVKLVPVSFSKAARKKD